MMRIVLVPSRSKPLAQQMVPHLVTLLKKEGATPLLLEELISPQKTPIDLILSIGGDGTLIRTYHQLMDYQAPIIGINLGNLGFLTDMSISQTPNQLKAILKGLFSIEKRTMLSCHWNQKKLPAINDLVIHRAAQPNLVSIEVSVDGKFLNTFRADGMIFATPTGSTAYALAAGGPILTPTMRGCLVTPICPHTISNRAIVIDTFEKIKVTYLDGPEDVAISVDGSMLGKLRLGESIELSYHSKPLLLAHTHDYDFYSIVRSKLGWSGGLTSPPSLTAYFDV